MENYNTQGGYENRPQLPPYIGLVEAVKICFNKYTDFTGRATRAEFWWWELFTFIVSLAISSLSFIFGSTGASVISFAVTLALFIPSLAVTWRRLHDIGRAGGWYFIGLIPIVGWIMLLIWYVTPSEPQDNRFGPYVG